MSAEEFYKERYKESHPEISEITITPQQLRTTLFKFAESYAKHETKNIQKLVHDTSYENVRLRDHAKALQKQVDELWDRDKVMDFVNWYVKLHLLPVNYEIENATLLDDFEEQALNK